MEHKKLPAMKQWTLNSLEYNHSFRSLKYLTAMTVMVCDQTDFLRWEFQ